MVDTVTFRNELLDAPPPDEATRLISKRCARAWHAFPADFDARSSRLTLAVADPGSAHRIEKVYRLLLQPYALQFAIAPKPEIDAAIDKFLREPEPTPAQDTVFPTSLPKQPKAEHRPRRTPQATQPDPGTRTPSTVPTNTRPARREAFSYEQMSQALTSAAMLLSRLHLGDDLESLALLRTRVRYCQLVASRLRFSVMQTDTVTLAAWLSVFKERRELVRRFVAPHGIERILFPEDFFKDGHPPEAMLLRLVEGFQDLGRTAPDICRDVNLTRKELRLRWSSTPEHQNMLEAFLQILVDEEFLTEMEGTAGRVLIVDPDEAQSCLLAPALVSVGYEVITVPDLEMAEEFMPDFLPDAVIVEAGLPNQAALQLCEKIKGRPDTARTIILAVVEHDNNRLAVRCLSSGADDFVSKPVDPELLMLKLQSRLDAAPGHDTGLRGGVSGSLDDMSFTDLIQILSAGRKSLCIHLTEENKAGDVFVKDGDVVHAQVGDLRGEGAFYEMMQWTSGAFSASQCAEFPENTIHASTMSLLMEGARLADEGAPDA